MVDGFQPNMPTDELLALRIRMFDKRQQDLDKAANQLALSRFKTKERFMKEFRYRIQDQFKTGDLVLVRNSTIEESLNRKVQQRYFGPYQIAYGIGEGENHRHSYIIQEMDGTIAKALIAAKRLIPYRPRAIYEDVDI